MFNLRVLGGAVLESAEGRVKGAAAQRRRLALLVLLARSRGRPLGRDKVIGLLWPEHSTDAARHLLAQALYQIRRALPQEPFITPGDEVALNEQVLTCDANAFEDAIAAGALEGAVEMYRGDFLDGFFLPDAAEFERWVEEERGRLRRAHGQVLEGLAEGAEGRDEPLSAAAWWQRAAEHEPYSSRLILRLMRALEWGGEHLAAIRAAEKHAEFLREDIGASADPEVLAYAERLRTNPLPGQIPPLPERSGRQADEIAEKADPVAERLEGSPPVGLAALTVTSGTDVLPNSIAPAAITGPGARQRQSRSRLVAMTISGLIAATFILVVILRTRPDSASAAPRDSRLDPRRVAVLYFDDMSEHRDAEHIAAGLTEGLIHELTQVRSLDVISRHGVKPFRGKAVSLDSIVSVLHPGSIVEGSVQRVGDRLRITVQLIDVSSGTHLQSRTLVRPIDELFALEGALSLEVSRFLRERLGEEIRIREHGHGTRNAAAREALMRAGELYGRTERAAGEPDPLGPEVRIRTLQRADSLLALAEGEDPRWAEPPLRRGWVSLALAETRPDSQRSADLVRAVAQAERVLARHPGHPGALELRGTARWRIARLDTPVSEGERRSLLSSVEQDLKAVLELDPSRATAWSTLSQYLRLQGRVSEADVAARRALEADEFLSDADQILERLYRSALMVGRFDEALKWCDEGHQRFPTNWRFVECDLTLLGYGQGTPQDVERAWMLRRELEQLHPVAYARAEGRAYNPIFRDMNVAMVLARAGMRDSARAMVARALRSAGNNPDLNVSLTYDRARVAYVLGDTTETLRQLAAYVGAKPRARDAIAQDVTFVGLREHPEFRAIVTPAGTATTS
jgi:DNA-binding SARP family transcriptional activator/TolB-like protein